MLWNLVFQTLDINWRWFLFIYTNIDLHNSCDNFHFHYSSMGNSKNSVMYTLPLKWCKDNLSYTLNHIALTIVIFFICVNGKPSIDNDYYGQVWGVKKEKQPSYQSYSVHPDKLNSVIKTVGGITLKCGLNVYFSSIRKLKLFLAFPVTLFTCGVKDTFDEISTPRQVAWLATESGWSFRVYTVCVDFLHLDMCIFMELVDDKCPLPLRPYTMRLSRVSRQSYLSVNDTVISTHCYQQN